MKALKPLQADITTGGNGTGMAIRAGIAVTGGLTVSMAAAPAPSAGQVPTATGSATAIWQTPTIFFNDPVAWMMI